MNQTDYEQIGVEAERASLERNYGSEQESDDMKVRVREEQFIFCILVLIQASSVWGKLLLHHWVTTVRYSSQSHCGSVSGQPILPISCRL